MSNTTKNQLLKYTLTLLISCVSLSAYSQDKSASDNRGSDKVDLKKLEDKYWSAKDDDYGVIQNRTFSKGKKFFGSLVYGPLVNDAFAKSRAIGGMLGYYFNEDFGIEGHYFNYDSKKSDSVENFNSLSSAGVSPNYNLIKSAYSLSLSYTPFYAKMAFMNKAILYFDMGFTAGLGMTNYDQIIYKRVQGAGTPIGEDKDTASAPHFDLGVMQQLFLNKNFAFRLDIKNTFYTQKVKKYDVGISGDQNNRPEETKSGNDTTITVGITLFTN